MIINDWDIWRTEINQDGDSENTRMTKKQRKSKELFNAVVEDFKPSKDNSKSRKKVEGWINAIRDDAEFNLSSYSECFVSENLLRRYISEKSISLSKEAQDSANKWKQQEIKSKQAGNINFEIREGKTDLAYIDMDHLARVADDASDRITKATLVRDASEYKPIRDAIAHTSRLTSIAKMRLTITYENIKERIVSLLNMA